MKAAFVLALIVSAVVLPLQPAFAVVDLQLLIGGAQLDTRDVVIMEATHIVIGTKPPTQSATVIVNGDKFTCTTVVVTGCPTPTEVVLSDCSDAQGPVANVYTIDPGGPTVGTFDDGDSITGTVFNGQIRLTCRTIPPPPAKGR